MFLSTTRHVVCIFSASMGSDVLQKWGNESYEDMAQIIETVDSSNR